MPRSKPNRWQKPWTLACLPVLNLGYMGQEPLSSSSSNSRAASSLFAERPIARVLQRSVDVSISLVGRAVRRGMQRPKKKRSWRWRRGLLHASSKRLFNPTTKITMPDLPAYTPSDPISGTDRPLRTLAINLSLATLPLYGYCMDLGWSYLLWKGVLSTDPPLIWQVQYSVV